MMFSPLVRISLATMLCLIGASGTAEAVSDSTLEKAGQGVAIALPLIAGGIAIYKDDWVGLGQESTDAIVDYGTAYALKQIVHVRRPDHSDFKSFPSTTQAVASVASSFLWARYGWRYGLPAFVVGGFVSYSLSHTKQNNWYDTIAASAIDAGVAHFLDTPYHEPRNFRTELSVTPDGASFRLAYNF
jgi:hypothetical protein